MGETAWDIYVFRLTFTPLMNNSDRDYVEFISNLPQGTYVTGFACVVSDTPCGNPGTTEGTPFTSAGFVTSVQEPSSLILLGLSFGALGLGRRRSSRLKAA